MMKKILSVAVVFFVMLGLAGQALASQLAIKSVQPSNELALVSVENQGREVKYVYFNVHGQVEKINLYFDNIQSGASSGGQIGRSGAIKVAPGETIYLEIKLPCGISQLIDVDVLELKQKKPVIRLI